MSHSSCFRSGEAPAGLAAGGEPDAPPVVFAADPVMLSWLPQKYIFPYRPLQQRFVGTDYYIRSK
jgi:hypothetical protein